MRFNFVSATPTEDTATDSGRISTIPLEELIESVDIPPMARSEQAWSSTVDISVYEEQIAGALRERAVREVFPDLRIRVVWGTETTGFVILGVWHLEDRLAKYAAEGVETWPVDFVKVDGANHFVS